MHGFLWEGKLEEKALLSTVWKVFLMINNTEIIKFFKRVKEVISCLTKEDVQMNNEHIKIYSSS